MVVDASAIAAWYLPSQATAASERLLMDLGRWDCVAPAIFEIEARNVMLLAERRKAQSPPDSLEKLRRIFELVKVTAEPLDEAAARWLPLARRSGLKLYDAAYLDLAISDGRPLASRDRQLLEAATTWGVEIFDLRDAA